MRSHVSSSTPTGSSCLLYVAMLVEISLCILNVSITRCARKVSAESVQKRPLGLGTFVA